MDCLILKGTRGYVKLQGHTKKFHVMHCGRQLLKYLWSPDIHDLYNPLPLHVGWSLLVNWNQQNAKKKKKKVKIFTSQTKFNEALDYTLFLFSFSVLLAYINGHCGTIHKMLLIKELRYNSGMGHWISSSQYQILSTNT